jgi:hypothetical protein
MEGVHELYGNEGHEDQHTNTNMTVTQPYLHHQVFC